MEQDCRDGRRCAAMAAAHVRAVAVPFLLPLPGPATEGEREALRTPYPGPLRIPRPPRKPFGTPGADR